MESPSKTAIRINHCLRHAHRQPFELQVDTQLPSSGVTAVFGPSGAGKSTLLRCIAGLEKSAATEVTVNGTVWSNAKTVLPAYKRRVGMVFQDSRLLPHLSGYENLVMAQKLGTSRAKASGAKNQGNAASALEEAIELLELEDFINQKPQEISGGETQRIAIARAIIGQPQLLLMDEPLASLGEKHKAEILPYIERLNKKLSIPTLYVSHSIREITRIADHLLVLEAGKLIESGATAEIIETGSTNFFEQDHAAVVINATICKRLGEWNLVGAAFKGGQLWLEDSGELVGDQVLLQIAAKDVSLMTVEPHGTSIQNRIKATISSIERKSNSAMTLVHLDANGAKLQAALTKRAASQLELKPGKAVWAMVKAVALAH